MGYRKQWRRKSNLGFALFDIVWLLIDKNIDQHAMSPGRFLNADKDTTEAVFEYVFRKDNDTIEFRYAKSADTVLKTESLSVNGTTIYSYDYDKKYFTEENLAAIEASTLNFKHLQNSLSILRYIANNTA